MKGTSPAPNRHQSSRMRPLIAVFVIAALLVAMLGVAFTDAGRALAAGFEQIDPDSAGIDADALRDFEDALVQAFLDNDDSLLAEMAAPDFRYATWDGDNRIIDTDEVIDLVDSVLVGPALAPIYLDNLGISQIEGIVDTDPLTLWGEDLPVVSVLMISGLTETGAGEALLAIAPDDDGAPLWVGMLVAEDGLPAAPAPGSEGETESEDAEEVVTEDDATASDESVDDAAEDVEAAENPVAAEERITLEILPGFAARTASLDGESANVYLVRAEAGQAITIDLTASSDEANFTVTGERNRQEYKSAANPARIWTLTVPATQEYRIVIDSPEPTLYILSLLISPVGHRLIDPGMPAVEEPAAEEPTAEEPAAKEEEPEAEPVVESIATPLPSYEPIEAVPNPQRVRLAAGETGDSIGGIMSAYGADGYLLEAQAGQTMYVTVNSPESIARFSISGYDDGVVLKPLNGETTWQGVLPTSQDYLVQIENDRGVRVQYTLNFEFSALTNVPPTNPVPTNTPTAQPQVPTPAPAQRITFPPGAISASINGFISANEVQGYVLAARAGQTMTVVISSPASNVGLSIVGADGTPFKRASVGGSGFSFALPTTQDYYVSAVGQGTATDYTLSVIIVN